jgi:hypothetical protein
MIKFDGAWRALYAERLWGEGIVVLHNGELLGCDSQYVYRGNYDTSSGATLTAHLEVQHYAGEPRSIFGEFGAVRLIKYTADLTSIEVQERVVVFEGTMNGNPDLIFRVRLERLLPVGQPTEA